MIYDCSTEVSSTRFNRPLERNFIRGVVGCNARGAGGGWAQKAADPHLPFKKTVPLGEVPVGALCTAPITLERMRMRPESIEAESEMNSGCL